MKRRRWSMRAGSIAGIQIRIHASMLLLVWLVLVAATEESGGVLGMAGWLALMFTCVLLHELAHSLVARRVGVDVEEIELLPIGGVSKMARIPDAPADELAIAAAGPLMSMVLGVAALAAAAAWTTAVWPPDLYSGPFIARLAWFNLIIAGFNLLPALPLDGGRVLRALLERRRGPYEATILAARIGRVFAIGFIAIGAFVNLFLMIIGVFVYIASRAEESASIVHHRLEQVTVGDVMIRQPAVVPAAEPASDLIPLLHATAQRQFPVVDAEGRYLGMVDARAGLGAPGATIGDLAVPVAPVHVADHVEDTALLQRQDGAALAVVEHGYVIGLVRADDIALLAQR